jgi:hypothetical protein
MKDVFESVDKPCDDIFKCPDFYKSTFLDQDIERIMNMKGFDGEFHRLLWFEQDRRKSIAFYVAMACVQRILGYSLPPEIREIIFHRIPTMPIVFQALHFEWSSPDLLDLSDAWSELKMQNPAEMQNFVEMQNPAASAA